MDNLKYDFATLFLPWDACVTRNKDLLGAGIDLKEYYNYERIERHEWILTALADSIANVGNLSIGTHALFFVGMGFIIEPMIGTLKTQRFIPDPAGRPVGFEMNPPCVHYLYLDDYVPDQSKPHIVAAFRCPYLRPDALSYAPSRVRMTAWANGLVDDRLEYGYEAIVKCFDPELPISVKRPDCSMTVAWGFHAEIEEFGLQCNMPKDWFNINAVTYMCTPYYMQQAFNGLGWGIPLITKSAY